MFRKALWVLAILTLGILVGCAKKEVKPNVNFEVLKEETAPTGGKIADLVIAPEVTKEDVFKLALYLNKTYDAYTIYDSKEIYNKMMNPPAPTDSTMTPLNPDDVSMHTLVRKTDKASSAFWVKDNLQEEIK